jgi:hypothetical protein
MQGSVERPPAAPDGEPTWCRRILSKTPSAYIVQTRYADHRCAAQASYGQCQRPPSGSSVLNSTLELVLICRSTRLIATLWTRSLVGRSPSPLSGDTAVSGHGPGILSLWATRSQTLAYALLSLVIAERPLGRKRSKWDINGNYESIEPRSFTCCLHIGASHAGISTMKRLRQQRSALADSLGMALSAPSWAFSLSHIRPSVRHIHDSRVRPRSRTGARKRRHSYQTPGHVRDPRSTFASDCSARGKPALSSVLSRSVGPCHHTSCRPSSRCGLSSDPLSPFEASLFPLSYFYPVLCRTLRTGRPYARRPRAPDPRCPTHGQISHQPWEANIRVQVPRPSSFQRSVVRTDRPHRAVLEFVSEAGLAQGIAGPDRLA